MALVALEPIAGVLPAATAGTTPRVEISPIFSTTFNRAVQVEARADHLSADCGTLVVREIKECTGSSSG